MLAIEVAYTALIGKPFVRSYKADQVLAMEAPVRRMYSARTHRENARMASDRPARVPAATPRPSNVLDIRWCAASDLFGDGSKRTHASDRCGSL